MTSLFETLNSLEAEQAVLGTVLFDNIALEAISELRPEHFAEPIHACIFAQILTLIGRARLAGPVAVNEALKSDEAFRELGGLRYLADLVDKAPPPPTAADFAATVMDHAARRALVQFSVETRHAAVRTITPASEVIAAAEIQLAQIAQISGAPSNWLSAEQIVNEAIAIARTGAGLVGFSTGIGDLDQALGGLRPGQLIIVGGRPGMGKSTAGLQIAKAVAQQGRSVLFFSLEMPPFDLGLRMACDLAHDRSAPHYSGRSASPRYFDAARNLLNEDGWAALENATAEIANWPLVFDVRPGLTVREMQALALRRFRQFERNGVPRGCIIADHITIVRPAEKRGGNKVAEIGDISRELAVMAKTLGVPVVGLAQLSRDVEKRGESDRRPTLADLRWSGEIEQDARVVALLYRPEYYLQRPPENQDDDAAQIAWAGKLKRARNKLWWLIAKNNNGPTGEVETYCDMARSAIRGKLGNTDV